MFSFYYLDFLLHGLMILFFLYIWSSWTFWCSFIFTIRKQLVSLSLLYSLLQLHGIKYAELCFRSRRFGQERYLWRDWTTTEYRSDVWTTDPDFFLIYHLCMAVRPWEIFFMCLDYHLWVWSNVISRGWSLSWNYGLKELKFRRVLNVGLQYSDALNSQCVNY